METVPRGRVTGGGPRNPLTTFFIALVRQEFAKGGRGNKEEAEERRYWSRMQHASNRTHSTVIHVRQFLVSCSTEKGGRSNLFWRTSTPWQSCHGNASIHRGLRCIARSREPDGGILSFRPRSIGRWHCTKQFRHFDACLTRVTSMQFFHRNVAWFP